MTKLDLTLVPGLRIGVAGAALTTLLALPGCSGTSDTDPATTGEEATTGSEPEQFELLESEIDRIVDPDASETELDIMRQDNWSFALDLYGVLDRGDDNVMISPLSLRTAFAQAWAGARTTSQTQIAEAMSFSLDPPRLHAAMNALDLALDSRNDPGDEDNPPVILRPTNALFSLPDMAPRIEPAYLDTLKRNYGTGVRLTDFRTDPEASRQIINGWVADRTEDRIPELLPPGSINDKVLMVLVNALYFNAPWADPFDEDLTSSGSFAKLDGSTVSTPMMADPEASVAYAEGPDYKAIELPYRRGELSMVLVLPTQDFGEFEAGLDEPKLERITDGLVHDLVDVKIPKFEFSFGTLSLRASLRALSMIDPFEETAADFTGVTDALMYIFDVYHQTYISVDEQGTEAAAATAVVFGVEGGDAPDPIVEKQFHADRPFFFLIRDRQTGLILFFGRVVDPTAS